MLKQKATKLVMMQDLNPYGTLFGGTLMGWMDQEALMLAVQYARCNCVTVKFSEINFRESVHLKDMLELHSEITSVGNTSITIRIQAYKLCFKCTEPVLVADANAVFVAVDDKGQPMTIQK